MHQRGALAPFSGHDHWAFGRTACVVCTCRHDSRVVRARVHVPLAVEGRRKHVGRGRVHRTSPPTHRTQRLALHALCLLRAADLSGALHSPCSPGSARQFGAARTSVVAAILAGASPKRRPDRRDRDPCCVSSRVQFRFSKGSTGFRPRTGSGRRHNGPGRSGVRRGWRSTSCG